MKDAKGRLLGCLVVVAGAIVGAILGALCGAVVYATVVAPPPARVDDPEGRLAQGIGRAIEVLSASLVGLVPGAIIGGAGAWRLARKAEGARRPSIDEP